MAAKKDNTIRFKSGEKIVLTFIQKHNDNIVKTKQRIQKELAKLREIRFLKKLASNAGKSFDWLDQLEKDTESGIDMLKRWAKTNDKEIKEVEDNTIREPISLEEVQKAVKELQNAVRSVIDILDAMDDETYGAVNDFASPNEGRYTDMIEWLQHIMSVR